MKIILLLLIMVNFCCAIVSAQQKNQNTNESDANPMSLVAIEQEFAKMSVEKGIKASFTEFLADDSIIFPRGEPINGKQFYLKAKENGGLLTWYPVFAQVSAAGDLGYSTGPYEYRDNPKAEIADIYGTFLTIWKRQADGSWKAVLDRGIFHQKPDETLLLQTLSTAPKPKNIEKINLEKERDDLKKLDEKLSQDTFKKGEIKSLPAVADPNIRVYRENKFPLIGLENVRPVLLTEPGLLSWKPQFVDVARSGDLGYFYGVYQIKDKSGADGKVIEEGSYIRIWTKQPGGKWKVAIDLLRSKKKSG